MIMAKLNLYIITLIQKLTKKNVIFDKKLYILFYPHSNNINDYLLSRGEGFEWDVDFK